MAEDTESIFEQLVFNGINGATGEYALPPMSPEQLSRFIQGKGSPAELPGLALTGTPGVPTPEEEAADQETKGLLEIKRAAPFPVKEGVDPLKLDQAGWAILFPATMDAQLKAGIKEALSPLLKLRQQQAGARYRSFEDGAGYRPGERLDQFFRRQRPEIAKGAADPEEMPFYVMVVGSPDDIPYEFQYQLDVMRGVGRLDFGSDLESYARYAQNVVAAETGKVKLDRKMTFFGAANPGDKATQLSSKYLIQPLYDNLQQAAPGSEIALKYSWQFNRFVGEGQATKAQLGQLLGGNAALTPALLMTASHGVEFTPGDERQLRYQGALLCQDWGGPGSTMSRDYYFAGEDLPASANLAGLIAMFFACYGAGTPLMDQFARQAFKQRQPIASRNFVAALPQKMLRQGALAVIGHVERAWGYSFILPGGGDDTQAFVTAMRKLLNGEPVGLATDPSFNMRYADMSSALSSVLDELKWTPNYVSDAELAQMWSANNDARSYVVIGDPAVRVPFAKNEEAPAARPDLGTVTVPVVAAAPAAGVSVESAAGSPPVEMGVVAFGLVDQFGDLTASLKKFTAQLADALGKAADEISTLEVETYSTSDLAAAVAAGADAASKSTLRAYTRIAFDGDAKVFVPGKEGGGIDQEVWQAHLAMVHEAQISRAQFLQSMAELATNLLKTLKP